jgi:O-antigen/teichoic acid export membrane protein
VKSTTLESIHPALRGRIVSGMRWTLWLSAITAPLGYATTVLLARVGPGAVGTYGLVILYTLVSCCVFYFGGDAVVIKFLPGMDPRKKLSFLVTYFGIICLTLLPWLGAALIWPQKLHYIFGKETSPRTQIVLVCLSPIYILFSIVQAHLKADMHFRDAQLLLRIVTVGSFLIYASLYLFARPFLSTSYSWLLWVVYLSLVSVVTAIGTQRVLRSHRTGARIRIFLPRGFWRYAITTEQVSALAFFAGRLDFLLVLNYGGLLVFGQYVAVVSLAETLKTINRSLVDSLFPALTNLIAVHNYAGVAELFSVNLRILLLVNCAVTNAIILAVGPIIGLLGPRYHSLQDVLIILVAFSGAALSAMLGGTLLSSFAMMEWQIVANVLQLAVFLALFFVLWPQWNLKGAALATGASMLVSCLFPLVVGERVTGITLVYVKDYVILLLAILASALFSLHFLPLRLTTALATWLVVMAGFVLAAGYSVTECKSILHYFLPSRLGARL